MYSRVALANTICKSVFTLILDTPIVIALCTWSNGIPEPPCNTNGLPFTAASISANLSKFNPAQSAG